MEPYVWILVCFCLQLCEAIVIIPVLHRRRRQRKLAKKGVTVGAEILLSPARKRWIIGLWSARTVISVVQVILAMTVMEWGFWESVLVYLFLEPYFWGIGLVIFACSFSLMLLTEQRETAEKEKLKTAECKNKG